jgi:hypothetical protein
MTIAELQKKIADLKEENAHRLKRVKAEQSTWSSVGTMIKVLEVQLKKLEDEQAQLPEVTDHALLRFAERVEGFDAEAAKRKIFTPEFLKQYKTLGDGQYPVNGFTVVVRKGIVRTILNNVKGEG